MFVLILNVVIKFTGAQKYYEIFYTKLLM